MTTTKPAVLRAEPHDTIGAVIARDAAAIIERWARRAVEDQPSAKRVHHDVLLDHFPTLLWELGKALASAGTDRDHHDRPAGVHGDQRWDAGWSVEEVVRDYQLLRLVVTAHLDETLGRPLTAREVMALGVFLDDAITASVGAYVACQTAAKSTGPRPEEVFDVLGVVGHELRNPLAPLGNALQILKLAAADPAVVERSRLLMERQHRAMSRLVEDLLDLPRIARGKMQLRPGLLDLVRLVRDVVEDRRAAFDQAGLRLAVELPADPVHTNGDALRLTQVVGNLLGNAAKFTDRGGEVVVALVRDPTRPVAVLTVRDSGIGIEPAVLPGIFDAFVQADRALDRTRGGLGLGLALVKGIVELHSGTVRAASGGPGQGSEFTVELPIIDVRPEQPGERTPDLDQHPARSRGEPATVGQPSANGTDGVAPPADG